MFGYSDHDKNRGPGPCRMWVYTINNPTTESKKYVQLINRVKEVMRHACVLEVGTVGTHHFQGAITLKQPVRRKELVELLGGKCWVEKMIATTNNGRDAFDYVLHQGKSAEKPGLLELICDIDNHVGQGI